MARIFPGGTCRVQATENNSMELKDMVGLGGGWEVSWKGRGHNRKDPVTRPRFLNPFSEDDAEEPDVFWPGKR